VKAFLSLPDDAFEHVGSILVNISKQREGRKLLLDPKRGLLKQIIRQFDSNSSLRKKGVCAINALKMISVYQPCVLGNV